MSRNVVGRMDESGIEIERNSVTPHRLQTTRIYPNPGLVIAATDHVCHFKNDRILQNKHSLEQLIFKLFFLSLLLDGKSGE